VAVPIGTADVIRTLERNGVNMIKIGIPFSDPMADGPVIQDAAVKALRNGMSFRDYITEYKPVADRFNLRMIMLITPETSIERVLLIDENTSGLIYMASSAATTGAQKDFDAACAHASGGIIGSRFVTPLDQNDGDAQKAISRLKSDIGM